MANTGIITQKAAEMQNGGSKQTMAQYVKRMEKEIAKALPSAITPERFTRIALSALSNTPKLGECTSHSFLGALMNAAQLGLEPNTPLGHAYLIPFNNRKKGTVECQFQVGYKGMIDLARRSGEISMIDAHVVYENDEFAYEYGLEPGLVHKPAVSNRGEPVAYYALFKLINGGFGFSVMSREDVVAHARKYSQAYNSGPWQTNFDEMAKKTVLKQTLKYAPMKSEFVRGITLDGSVANEIDYETGEVLVDADELIEVDDSTGEAIDDPEADNKPEALEGQVEI